MFVDRFDAHPRHHCHSVGPQGIRTLLRCEPPMSASQVMSDWREDPLEELGRELRHTVGREFQAEAEVTEHETSIGRLRRLGLAEVARSAMHRGDAISLITGSRTITGMAVFTGKDYLICQTATELFDAPFDRVVIKIEPRASGGHSTQGGAITFRARLAEYEQTGESVSLVCADSSLEVFGAIAVVASDHCILQESDGSRFHIPISQIALIARRRMDA